MESWKISEKLKKELLIKSNNIQDNSRRILFILRNLGPQRFTSLVKNSHLSRSTVSKYLTLHRKNKNLEQRLISDKESNKPYRFYVITDKGVEKLGEEPLQLKDDLFVIHKLKENVRKLEDLIDFYKKINLYPPFIIHIVQIVSKIGDDFFKLQQDRDLYMSLFYIFYNSILGQGTFANRYWVLDQPSSHDFKGYKLNLKEFCDSFKVDKEAIKYLAQVKIIKSNFGFYLIKRSDADFFFHEEDLLGTTTFRLIKDRLTYEIINLQEGISGSKAIYDLDKMSEEICVELKEMGLIWDEIIEQFQLLVLNLIIKNAIEMGFLNIERDKFIKGLNQSKKIGASEEGRLLKKIIDGENESVNLNTLTLNNFNKTEN